MEYPLPYLEYLVQFHARRDYFECHEILEAYWKEHPSETFGPCWVGLIQTAVGLYHHRRGNAAGAIKMFRSAHRNLAEGKLELLGIEKEKLLQMLEERVLRLNAGADTQAAYSDFDLPLSDSALERRCRELCAADNLRWGIRSDMSDTYLLHKHTLRDRSDVIAARRAAASLHRSARARRSGDE